MKRADVVLVERGLVASRAEASELIRAGLVRADNESVDKPSRKIADDADILVQQGRRYVSRAGMKLEALLEHTGLDVQGARVLDVGASTGGFTDCALQRGAAAVVCVDVGHGQLHPAIAADSRVTNLEGVNARYLGGALLDHNNGRQFDCVVMDLSFISQRKVLPVLGPLLRRGGHLCSLIKPQFELSPSDIGKGGLVNDPDAHQRACDAVSREAVSSGFTVLDLVASPITGGDGNREFLLLAQRWPNAG